MKHVKLFEDFFYSKDTNILSAVGVFLETQMAVGVFPTAEATKIYERLKRSISENADHIDVEMIEIPEGDDLIIVPLGGKGISTSNEEQMKNYGDPVHDIVELGKTYNYGENESQMVFRVNSDVDGFIVLDSAGGTRLVSPEEIDEIIF
jgi:hypothetical protein